MHYLKSSVLLIVLVIVVALGGGWWFMKSAGEREEPTVSLSEDVRAIGLRKVIGISLGDRVSGLRNYSVTLSQDNKVRTVDASTFPQKGVKQKTLSLTVNPPALKLHDGFAILNVTAVDFSLWKNKTVLERPVNIDYTPPGIYLYTPVNRINAGGTCVAAFGVSEPATMVGVQVNGNFSPGYHATIGGKPAFVTYFGVPLNIAEAGAAIRLRARDEGDNETSSSLPAVIKKKKKFRSDAMELSDGFLNQKMIDFQPLPPEMQGKSPIETFIYINGKMRNENEDAIRRVSLKSEPHQLWEGAFLRMKNASPMASFGEHRTYLYQKKVVGESYHWGVDLASTANAPAEAANNGTVVFAGLLGIYGNAIIIDHGLGIVSVYGHLSAISVKTGQKIRKGEQIGRTGSTGLAGGDHLHFGMLAGGQFVNPVEWWDPHWIKDNVTDKLALQAK